MREKVPFQIGNCYLLDMRILVISSFLTLSACAYHFGMSDRALPGGYNQVAIPVFQNKTQDVGVEMRFTNALIRRFARSQVARVTNKDTAPVTLEGSITKIVTTSGPAVTNKELQTLPDSAILTTEYRLTVTTSLQLKRKSDDKVIWQGNFTSERAYAAPRLGTPVVNSVNATYNQSVRMETIARLADDMMTEAHDRMTENF